MQIIANTKFNIGDVVYTIEEREVHVPCKRCNGEGAILIKDSPKVCDVCFGSKTTENEQWIVSHKGEPTAVDRIWVRQTKTKQEISYGLSDETIRKIGPYLGYSADEVNCFSTLEEAKAECERRNEKGIHSWNMEDEDEED